ncbi:lumican [Tribolium castaneum]|uniref:Insulin-like growth factor-binding protein complex acid labile subunit n=1 Tax=Tribolium castaneum TaxID=7070 RepID=D2A3C6_TRICA|nr:PREDICTED: lumican [Tribolium castaneum]EFA02291.1 Insulin-like growth factor-binding protein complex acid labile subunit [Tribolium castaneum]|eukprot:XP_008191918.2 PREDICTED: lumican [Tribolium castaneum]
MRHLIALLLTVLLYNESDAACRHSYMTFCDDLSDLGNYNIEDWREIVVGTESYNASQLKTIDHTSLPFYKMERLVTLIIVGQIKEIKMFTFALNHYYNRLNVLEFYANDIKRIKFTTFDTMTLTKLGLVNNNIENLSKGMFYNCHITTIDVSHNKLEAIEVDVFTETNLYNSTKELILRHNRIELMESGCLPSSLEILNLDHNKMNVINIELFKNVCCLKELTLSHNNLKNIAFAIVLNQLRWLDASHNIVKVVYSQHLNNLTKLEVLDLGHNIIDSPVVFKRFNLTQRALQISLAFNKLTHLVIDENNFRDHVVYLYGNPWNCKCWQMLEQFMIDNKVKRSACDLKFFGNGEVPYCLEYGQSDCRSGSFDKNTNITRHDIDTFTNVVKDTLNKIKCRHSPRLWQK